MDARPERRILGGRSHNTLVAMRALVCSIIVLFLSGCYKTELDGLDNNPFDAEYAGPAIFTLASDTVVLLQNPNGSTNRRFIQRIRVHTEYFLIPNTTYVVEGVNGANGNTVSLLSNQVEEGIIELSTDNTSSGAQYCWRRLSPARSNPSLVPVG